MFRSPSGNTRVVVSGSRGITDERFVFDALDGVADFFDGKVTWIHGGAKGVDSLVSDYAAIQDDAIKVMYANWEELGKRAGILRNIEMADEADFVLAIWDGGSKGTKHMIDHCIGIGVPVLVVTY